jgi:two-component system C4-dicarboxylate transport sensor histidine kinase DctB
VALAEMNKRLQEEIDEHNRTDKALREAQAELVQSSKLAALGHMAAGIVHELNQPIAAIRTHAASGRLLLERQETDKLLSTLTAITRMTEHLGSITVQLKTFARKSPTVREPIVLQECLEDALTMTAALINEEEVSLIKDLPDAPLVVHGNRGRVNQVLVNLIRNAVDAMQSQVIKKLHISMTSDHRQVALSIADSGAGIRDQDREEIFTPFFTTKEVGEGLGLGLSISYRIITDLGGSIRALNNEEGGTTFIVIFPGGSVVDGGDGR